MTERVVCSIEGCARSTAKRFDAWICSVHWRRYCPPKSARRRAWLAIRRRAKRYGWTPELAARQDRFWDALVRSGNRLERLGYPDMTAINKPFGWDDETRA